MTAELERAISTLIRVKGGLDVSLGEADRVLRVALALNHRLLREKMRDARPLTELLRQRIERILLSLEE